MTSTTLKGVHSTSSLPPTLPPTHTLTLPHSYPPSLFPSLPPSSPLTLPPSYPPSLPSFSQLLTPSQPIRYHAMPCHAMPSLVFTVNHSTNVEVFFLFEHSDINQLNRFQLYHVIWPLAVLSSLPLTSSLLSADWSVLT